VTTELLKQLHDDHLNVVELIGIARGEIDSIQAGRSPNYELLETVMRYLTEYSDACHHPTEDVLFQQLRVRSPNRKEAVDGLLLEHEKLKVSGRGLLVAVESIIEGEIVRLKDVLASAQDYFALLEEHMNQEESFWFPLLRNSLSAEDWTAAEQLACQIQDPLFGPATTQQFHQLAERMRPTDDSGSAA
jgi:hemerythrin-like domain-containing protein